MYRIHRAVHWAPLDAYIRSLNPAAWFRPYRAPGTVTVTGSGVSQIADYTGNARHLKQGTDANRPNCLQTGAVTAVGSGSAFTRATVATVEDFEGAIKVVKSGEVRFPGARRVENFCINTGFLAGTVDGSPGTAPTGVSISLAVAGITRTIAHGEDVYGKYLEVRFVGTNNSGSVFYGACYSMTSNAVPAVVGQTWVVSGKVALVAGMWPTQARIQLAENSSAPAYLTASTDLINSKVTGASPVYLSLSRTLSNASCAYAQPSIAGFQINNGEVVDFTARVYEPQFENVTGQSNQDPSEYVSVGVLSSPFHGAMVDGVKYFEYENGNTVAGNVVTEATGATLNTLAGTLVETASTNLVLQSSNFGTTWAAVGTPTRSAAAKYCGSIALDLIGDDDGAALEGYSQTITFTGNAVKSVSFLIAQGTSTSTVVALVDTTATANRVLGVVTWSGGVPTYTPTTGTQERAPEAMGNGVWRIYVASSAVTAANTNSLRFYPASDAALSTAATGTVYLGGVQAENALVASSHIPTTTGTVTRNADRIADTLGDAIYGDGAAFKMATDAFTANQPRTRLSVVYPISWTSGDFLDSGTAAEAGLTQTGSTPSVSLNAGSAAAANTGLTLGAWHVVCEVINGASSSVTVDNGAETTGDAGANNPGGIALFSNQAGSGYFNGMIREYIDLPIALDATQRARIVAGLMARHGVA